MCISTWSSFAWIRLFCRRSFLSRPMIHDRRHMWCVLRANNGKSECGASTQNSCYCLTEILRFFYFLIDKRKSTTNRAHGSIKGVVSSSSSNGPASWWFSHPQKKTCRGFVKKPSPFTCVFFSHVIVVFSDRLIFQALASHLDQRIHMREEREKDYRKRKGRERNE